MARTIEPRKPFKRGDPYSRATRLDIRSFDHSSYGGCNQEWTTEQEITLQPLPGSAVLATWRGLELVLLA